MELIQGSEGVVSPVAMPSTSKHRKVGSSLRKVLGRKRKRLTKPIVQVDRRSEKFNQFLRDKFIETAKKYIGVPYKKSLLGPTDPNYNAPLFLDCCGLVKKVVLDLQKYFGFKIGKWNQSYQYDTLPRSLSFEEMKPGDLVFYQGKYCDKTKRNQIHHMTHVEIFLGGETGESTIGARYKTGTIQIFDSYKFESKTWDLTRYHFKSIDTWIEGICKSFCGTHRWGRFKKKKNKGTTESSENKASSKPPTTATQGIPKTTSATQISARKFNLTQEQKKN